MSKRSPKKKVEQTSKKASRSIKETQSEESFFSRMLPLLLLGGMTFLAFSNTLSNEFVNWDDDRNFYKNELITSLNKENFWDNTVAIFKTPVIGNYNPLSIWTFLIDQKMYGLDNPSGWHLTNVFLHIIGVLLLYGIGLKMKLSKLGAVILAAMFAIHPMRVESVAWVTERKDVLFGAFFLGAVYQYLRYKLNGVKSAYSWMLVLFLLSCLSKIQAVTFPLTIIAIDYYLDRELNIKSMLRKWPLFLISLITGLVGIYFLKDQGSLDTSNTDFSFLQRLCIGAYSYVVYIVKSIVPYRMSPLYPYPSVLPWYIYASAIPAIGILSAGVWAVLKKKIVWGFGFMFYTFNIMFLLQILGAGQAFIADRFTYIAHIGLYFILVYFIEKGLKTKFNTYVKLGVAALGIAFAFLTYKQNKVWKDSGTLWTHVLKYYQDARLPYGNRANFYRDNGELTKALNDYGEAIRLGEIGNDKKALSQSYNSRARLYFDKSNRQDTLRLALQDYNRALELNPTDGEFYSNRGATYARLGDLNNALSDLTKSIEFKPDHAVAYMNRSIIYRNINQLDKAVADLTMYTQLRPYNADIWFEKGKLEQQMVQSQLALSSMNRAITLNPNKGLYYFGRSQLYYYSFQDMNAAKADLQMAKSLGYTTIDPAYANALGM